MKKSKAKKTVTIDDHPGGSGEKKSSRKNTNKSTRGADRQRSGNNDPQRGSH